MRMKRLLRGMLLGTVLGMLLFFLGGGLLSPLEEDLYDLRMCLRDPPSPDNRILIVAIDRRSQDVLGAMPWDRTHHARLIRNLTRAGARAIAFDIFFPGKEDPQNGQKLPPGKADLALAEAMRRHGNVVVPIENLPYGQGEEGFAGKQYVFPSTPIGKAAAGIAFAEVPLDRHEVIRQCSLRKELADGTYPFLALALLGRFMGRSTEGLTGDDNNLSWDSFEIPLHKGMFPITFHGTRGTYRSLSYVDVLLMNSPPDPLPDGVALSYIPRRIGPEEISGSMVLIGSTIDRDDSRRLTPLSGLAAGEGGYVPGVEIQANVADSLMNRQFIHYPPRNLDLVVTIAVGLLVGILVVIEPMFLSLGLAAIAGIAIFFSTTMIFRERGIMFNMAVPLALTAVLFLIGAVRHVWRTWVERRRLQALNQMMENMARQFMHAEIYRVMVEQRKPSEELTAQKSGSVLFTDVANYTELSELHDMDAMANQLMELFTASENIVTRHGGMVVKLTGDAQIMLFREEEGTKSAPIHAVEAALELEALFKKLKYEWEARKMIPLHSGIGIASGRVWVGLMGASGRKTYDIIGPPVNRAARIQDYSKKGADFRLVIDEETAQTVRDRFVLKEHPKVDLKGLGRQNLFEVRATKAGGNHASKT